MGSLPTLPPPQWSLAVNGSAARRVTITAVAWGLFGSAFAAAVDGRLGEATGLATTAVIWAIAGSGPAETLFEVFSGLRPKAVLSGSCARGYEEVARIFQRQMDAGAHYGAQCVAYVRGRKVVDLTASIPHSYRGFDVHYTADSVQNVFSSSKALSSLVVAMLADRGHLDLDKPISDIWPEFGRLGPTGEPLCVKDVMQHEAGLAHLGYTFSFEELSRSGISANRVGEVLAAIPSCWPEDTPRQYHAISRGWIENEIVRRADPLGRTVGQYLREEVAPALGSSAIFLLGEDLSTAPVAPLFTANPLWALLQSFVPSCMGRRVRWGPWWCLTHLVGELMKNVVKRDNLPFADPFAASKAAGLAGPRSKASLIDDWNHPLLRGTEIPSANCHTNARSMAVAASAIAEAAAPVGESEAKLLSTAGLSAAIGGATVKRDADLEALSKSTRVGWGVFDQDTADNRGGFIGWQGYGGSAMQFHPHPDLRIGFGFATNFAAIDLSNAAWADGYLHCELQREVLAAAIKEIQQS